jgi:hypothetical protein
MKWPEKKPKKLSWMAKRKEGKKQAQYVLSFVKDLALARQELGEERFLETLREAIKSIPLDDRKTVLQNMKALLSALSEVFDKGDKA